MSFWCLHFLPKNEREQVDLFVCFLEETMAWKNHFEFVWPLIARVLSHCNFTVSTVEMNLEKKSSPTSVYFSKAWLNHTCLQQYSKFRLREHQACYVWHLVKVLKDSKLGDLKLSTVHTKPKKVNQPVNSFF